MTNADLAVFYVVHSAFDFAFVFPVLFAIALLLKDMIYDHYDN